MQVTMRTEGDTPVLVLGGMADEGLLLRVVRGVEAFAEDVAGVVVVDVHGLVLSDVDAVRTFLARLLDGPLAHRIAFACGRLSGRRILVRFGGDGVRVFPTSRDAVDALAGVIAA